MKTELLAESIFSLVIHGVGTKAQIVSIIAEEIEKHYEPVSDSYKSEEEISKKWCEHWKNYWVKTQTEPRTCEALREAAERADEAIVKWFDPFSLYDIEDDLGEIRHKVEYAIMHADEPQPSCPWTEDPEGYWSTACGKSWTFIEGGPEENGIRYCHGCGKPVLIADETNKEE